MYLSPHALHRMGFSGGLLPLRRLQHAAGRAGALPARQPPLLRRFSEKKKLRRERREAVDSVRFVSRVSLLRCTAASAGASARDTLVHCLSSLPAQFLSSLTLLVIHIDRRRFAGPRRPPLLGRLLRYGRGGRRGEPVFHQAVDCSRPACPELITELLFTSLNL